MPPKPRDEKVKDTANTAAQERDAAQVADQPDPALDPVPDAVENVQVAPQADPAAQPNGDTTVRPPQDGDGGLCTEHFPQGWDTRTIRRTEEVTGVKSPTVTCEHGTYTRTL
jgi:hypothetical protein